MKLILEESQVNNMSEEKKADALYFLMNAYFPDNFEEDEWRGDSNVIAGRNDESDGRMLFYYRWDTKEFYMGIHFLEELHEKSGLFFLDYTEVRTNKRELFLNIIKAFAKKYYGWDVNTVLFHWYN